MNKIIKYAPISIPVLIGLGIALLGKQIIQNEENLDDRRIELEFQLYTK
tara:strand:- start:276 stop:422 length:147 start_codon:yes stop_codon:yes gene_type:complete